MAVQRLSVGHTPPTAWADDQMQRALYAKSVDSQEGLLLALLDETEEQLNKQVRPACVGLGIVPAEARMLSAPCEMHRCLVLLGLHLPCR